MKSFVHFIVLFFTGTCMACGRSEPPGAKSIAEAPSRTVGKSAALGTVSGSASNTRLSPAPSTIVDASVAVNTAAANEGELAVPNEGNGDSILLDEAGQPKPQTTDRPDANDPSVQARLALLCQSIIDGRPEKAHDAFFPLVAYRQVKAIEDPDRDYRLRLLRHFDRDILDYHRRLSKRPAPITCSGLKVPQTQARWMKPGSEYNRIGYFRVLRSQLGLTDASGNTFSLEVTSLISWRGQWYVVHLNGFE